MFGKRIDLFKVFGIPIRIDLSWLFIVALVTWTLAVGLFPSNYPDLPAQVYWIMGLAATLGLFVSVVLHELGHAMVALRYGVPMRGITLFIFGGVAEMDREPPSAVAEFMVAIAGPIMSIVLAVLFFLTYLGLEAVEASVAISGVLMYLAMINGLLVAFNLIPAFPLDGGRVLRSALWAWKNDLRRATNTASQIGAGFGLVLIVLGVLSLFTGNLIGGMWWILIGMFLRNAAQMSYQQVLIRQLLEGEPVRRFMHTDPISVPASASISELVEDYIYKHHHKLYPVAHDGTLKGCVSTKQVKELPREKWPDLTVGEVASPCNDNNTIQAGADAMEAFSRLHRSGSSRLVVLEGDQLVGMLTLKDLLQLIALKIELEDNGSPHTVIPSALDD